MKDETLEYYGNNLESPSYFQTNSLDINYDYERLIYRHNQKNIQRIFDRIIMEYPDYPYDFLLKQVEIELAYLNK